jgi:uncharacterized protein YecE (DUF72 family)
MRPGPCGTWRSGWPSRLGRLLSRVPGRLLVGTSGFAYQGWVPRFYPDGTPSGRFLEHYATRLSTVELNNTFYRSPSAAAVAAWLAATPADFRFSVKAQRGGSYRALQVDPVASVPWLTEPYRAFGTRLGTVLFRVPDGVGRNDDRLSALLAAWPGDLPLTLEFQDSSWHVDETFEALTRVGAALCTTELPEDNEPPTIRRTGRFLYLRLRRHDYTRDELVTWAGRLEPFLSAGDDVFVFFRHDEAGRGPELATELAAEVGRVLAG